MNTLDKYHKQKCSSPFFCQQVGRVCKQIQEFNPFQTITINHSFQIKTFNLQTVKHRIHLGTTKRDKFLYHALERSNGFQNKEPSGSEMTVKLYIVNLKLIILI